MLKCQDGQNIRVARGGGGRERRKLIATHSSPSSPQSMSSVKYKHPCLTSTQIKKQNVLSSPKDSQLSPARADKSSLWRQKSGQCGFKRRWGRGEGGLQRGKRTLLGCRLGLSFSAGYTGVCVCQNWCLHIKWVHLMGFPLYVSKMIEKNSTGISFKVLPFFQAPSYSSS